MFAKYKPTWMVNAIYDLTPEQLRKHGIKAVLTDLDNTLIAWNNPDGTDELRQWLQTMKQAEIPVIVVSNNKASRVERAIQALDLGYVSRALKPFSRGIRIGHERLQMSKDEVVMVGDQLMTDIRGANRAGVRSILVKPLIETDAWNTRINRFMERRVMKQLLKEHSDMKWRGDLGE
ncbi:MULTISPECIES: YqeG family HAD IIIA-type phosphatase [Enterococcus]|uniref:YqeG family HAD IIIA-type phosphatase n=1 Tax=Enterococcus TaxID=1350 RepID=UPI00065E5DE5|nr:MULTISPECIES: YqeG family HAD IIIA-type phosphatase [Enterococcus]KAF1300190.1 HAD family hydrolase [Enterococcus sp. JM9B]